MDSERYQQVRNALHEAGMLDGTARRAFLARQTEDVRAEVERLLAGSSVPTGRVAAPLELLSVASPERLAGYRVEEELGRGGMGVVYRARRDDGSAVALKVLYPHLHMDSRFTRRFAREAQIGGQVEHENVVRTFGAETDGDRPFLVMEYVEGKNLRELSRELGTVPETLLREIAAQVAAGLEAIHAAGIVHRDLKPENVLITSDQQVRIMDLGVAKLDQATVDLTREGQFLGSLHYAAPEQCDGGDVGPAADLYALGVLLYELATGINPFVREGAGAVIQAHLAAQPAPALRVNPEISLFFSEVLATLLEKNPIERFASSRALRAVLTAGETGAWWVQRERAIKLRKLPRIPVRRETALRGRAAESAVLERAWRRAQEGDGGAVLIEGEAGLGKTRLLAEFVRGVDAERAHILYGSFPPSGGLGGIVDAVDLSEEDLARYLAAAPGLVPDFAAFLRRENVAFRGDSLQTVCARLLAGLADEKPTLWIMEDLHFAPEEARGVAAALARELEGRRALLLFTSRVPIDALRPVERMPLTRLSPAEIAELVAHALDDELLAEELAPRIVEKSEGVPFFVLELLRGLREGKFEGVPSAIRDVIQARLADLDPDERAILDAGAVQGYEFDGELVARVVGRPLVQVLQELARIERARGVVRAAGRRYRFDHHQIQEVIYAELAERLREEYHALVAEAMGGDDPGALARHHLRGSRPEAGVAHLPAALEQLRRRHLYEDAITLAKLGLPHVEGEARAEVLFHLAAAQARIGRVPLDLLDEGLALAAVPALRARLLVAKGMHFSRTGEYDAALAAYDEAERVAEGEPFLRAKAVGGHARIQHLMGRFEEGLATAERQLALSREAGDAAGEAQGFVRLGVASMSLGDWARSQEMLEKGLRISRQRGDRYHEGITAGNLGVLAMRRGRSCDALEHLDHYFRCSRDIGYVHGEVIALLNRGQVVGRLGRAEETASLLERALRKARRLDQALLTAATHLAFGQVFADRQAYIEALALYERLGHAAEIVLCHVGLGRLDEAVALARTENERHALLEALARNGDTKEALELLAELEPRLSHRRHLTVRFDLWKQTRDPHQLDEARDLLRHFQDHAPPEDQESLLTFPLHGAIHHAWLKHAPES